MNPERCNKSRRDRDDNPFLSREAPDDEKQFNRSGFGRVFNETKFKKMLRKAFNHSILNEPENLVKSRLVLRKIQVVIGVADVILHVSKMQSTSS